MQYVSLSQNSLIFNSTDNNLSFTFLYSLFFFLTSTIVKTLQLCLLFSTDFRVKKERRRTTYMYTDSD